MTTCCSRCMRARALRPYGGSRTQRPAAPLVVALTGTDLYRDIRNDAEARQSLGLAARLDRAAGRGPAGVEPVPQAQDPRRLSVLGRDAAPCAGPVAVPRRRHRPPARREGPVSRGQALRRIERSAPVEVLQIGAALDREMRTRARALDEARAPLPLARQRGARNGDALARFQPRAGGELGHGRRRERHLRGGAHRRAGAGVARAGERRHAGPRLPGLFPAVR